MAGPQGGWASVALLAALATSRWVPGRDIVGGVVAGRAGVGAPRGRGMLLAAPVEIDLEHAKAE